MDSHFEQPKRFPEDTREKFESALREKTKTEIKRMVQAKIEEYYRRRVNNDEMEQAANRIFAMCLRGVPEIEIENELSRSLDSVLEDTE
jgi:hypothetical protein